MKTTKDLYELFQRLGINKIEYLHEPIYTVEQAKKACCAVPGWHIKNLFLKDHKDKLWLVVIDEDKVIRIKNLEKLISSGRLHFASTDTLRKYLGVEPGGVTPLGLINDLNHEITVVLDKEFFDKPQQLNFHPLRNDATIGISVNDFEKFIKHCGNHVVTVNFKS